MQASRLGSTVAKGWRPCCLAAGERSSDSDAGNQTATDINRSERKGAKLPRMSSLVRFTYSQFSRRLMQ